jgi:excisionase family DNA binding protein
MKKQVTRGPESAVMSVSEAARELGIAAKTVREWTAVGKLVCQRTQSGFRVYDAAAIRALRDELRA